MNTENIRRHVLLTLSQIIRRFNFLRESMYHKFDQNYRENYKNYDIKYVYYKNIIDKESNNIYW